MRIIIVPVKGTRRSQWRQMFVNFLFFFNFVRFDQVTMVKVSLMSRGRGRKSIIGRRIRHEAPYPEVNEGGSLPPRHVTCPVMRELTGKSLSI